MKRFRTILTTLTLLLVVCLALQPAKAHAASADDLTFSLSDDGKNYFVSSCNTAASGILTVPGTYEGKPVTGIGTAAFKGCDKLTQVSLPDSITSIGSYAFMRCSQLTKVKIPSGITVIDNFTFYECTSLTSINIPHTVKSIGYAAFQGCAGLTELSVADNVTTIQQAAFQDCAGLTVVSIPTSVSAIDQAAFNKCAALKKVYFAGSQEQWDAIIKGVYNEPLKSAELILAITEPDVPGDEEPSDMEEDTIEGIDGFD